MLYNKRFSLVFEWGHTWIDMNHYGKLLEIPVLGLPSADVRLHDAMPYPLKRVPATGAGRPGGVHHTAGIPAVGVVAFLSRPPGPLGRSRLGPDTHCSLWLESVGGRGADRY